MQLWEWVLAAGALCVVVTVVLARRSGARKPAVATPAPPPAAKPVEAREPEPRKAEARPKKQPPPDIERMPAPLVPPSQANLPSLGFEEEDEEIDPTRVGATLAKPPTPTKKIVQDDKANLEEPTQTTPIILVTAQAQTDRGLRRKRNEDSILAMPESGVFVVADGMGGYHGGEIASALAVSTIEKAFRTSTFVGEPHDNLPARASEVARAIQMANDAILERATNERELKGMGTTISAARFVTHKQRLYIGHVGDSRIYRVRDGELTRMTKDHTMADHGVTGPEAGHLSRAIGVWPTVAVDIVLGVPLSQDLYILCSDGLTKMVPDEEIASIATVERTPSEIVDALVSAANAHGGKDNISVIVVRVVSPSDIALGGS